MLLCLASMMSLSVAMELAAPAAAMVSCPGKALRLLLKCPLYPVIDLGCLVPKTKMQSPESLLLGAKLRGKCEPQHMYSLALALRAASSPNVPQDRGEELCPANLGGS